tara:strand:- start:9714 stop:10211 length:498 start_codon:yes stop_codon:yes gene_type:complete
VGGKILDGTFVNVEGLFKRSAPGSWIEKGDLFISSKVHVWTTPAEVKTLFYPLKSELLLKYQRLNIPRLMWGLVKKQKTLYVWEYKKRKNTYYLTAPKHTPHGSPAREALWNIHSNGKVCMGDVTIKSEDRQKVMDAFWGSKFSHSLHSTEQKTTLKEWIDKNDR